MAQQIRKTNVEQAREAASAHLDAVLKVNGAKYLRLLHLRESLQSRGYGKGEHVRLEADAGQEPRLWLDLAHVLTMEPDAKTYRLSYHSNNQIEILRQTESLDEAIAAAVNVSAHGIVASGRKLQGPAWSYATLLYVWLTGVVTGIAALALLVITLKKLPF